jgi:hypothetical protein
MTVSKLPLLPQTIEIEIERSQFKSQHESRKITENPEAFSSKIRYFLSFLLPRSEMKTRFNEQNSLTTEKYFASSISDVFHHSESRFRLGLYTSLFCFVKSNFRWNLQC